MKIYINELDKLPKYSGIYKVFSTQENKVVYIGQSKNIHQRWNNGHHKLPQLIALYGTKVYIECTEVPDWLLNRAEHTAISFHQPELNSRNAPLL